MKGQFPAWSRRSLAVVVLFAGAAWARGQETQVETRRTETTTTTTEVRRVSTVIGATVRVASDQEFGRVEDVVINQSGCIDYVVLAYEQRFYVVPWTVTTVDFGTKVITVDIARDRLLKAPSFTGDHWTEISTTAFREKLHTFYGERINRRERTEDRREQRRIDRDDRRRDERQERNRPDINRPRPERDRPETDRDRPQGTRPRPTTDRDQIPERPGTKPPQPDRPRQPQNPDKPDKDRQ